jgi:hypothetical protein
MSEKRKSPSAELSGKRKPYHSPRLTVHGDIRKLTRSKAGTKGDGSGKPATRTSGGQS